MNVLFRKQRRMVLLTAGLLCAAAVALGLSHGLSGPARTELYADQGQLRLTIAKVGREADFLLPSVQEQVANNDMQRQAPTPVRFRPGEPYFVIRGFIEDRSGQPLAQRVTVGPTEVADESGRTYAAVHVTYSGLRDEPSLARLYEPPAQGRALRQQDVQQAQWATSNSMNIRGQVNVGPATQEAFLPAQLLAFAAFFRPLSPGPKQVDLRHTALLAQVQQSEEIRFEDVTTTAPPVEKLATGYKVAVESLQHAPMRERVYVIGVDTERKNYEVRVCLRVRPAEGQGVLPETLRFTPPLLEDEMGDRDVCRKVEESWGGAAPSKSGTKGGAARTERREVWRAHLIDRDALRFTITTRLAVGAAPKEQQFVIRGIPVP